VLRDTGWDRQVRILCTSTGIIYQGFSLLTANQQALARPDISAIARRHGKILPQVVFRFAQQVGILPLTGTTDVGHMRSDLDLVGFQLDPDEVELIERLAEV
jgi:diketogulonate reductase-like aldo/keto reductase